MNQERLYNACLKRLRNATLADDAISYALEYAWLHPEKSPGYAVAHACYAVRHDVQRNARRNTAKVHRAIARNAEQPTLSLDLDHIPEPLRAVAERLATGTRPSDIADELGVSRPCISQRIDQLKAYFS